VIEPPPPHVCSGNTTTVADRETARGSCLRPMGSPSLSKSFSHGRLCNWCRIFEMTVTASRAKNAALVSFSINKRYRSSGCLLQGRESYALLLVSMRSFRPPPTTIVMVIFAPRKG
jgi:hypothetical protein